MKSSFYYSNQITKSKIEFRSKSILIESDLNLEPLEIGMFKFILIRRFFIMKIYPLAIKSIFNSVTHNASIVTLI